MIKTEIHNCQQQNNNDVLKLLGISLQNLLVYPQQSSICKQKIISNIDQISTGKKT